MAQQEQTVILSVTYDDEQSSPPETWAWHELIDCAADEVRVVMTGNIVASSDPTIDPTHHRKDPS